MPSSKPNRTPNVCFECRVCGRECQRYQMPSGPQPQFCSYDCQRSQKNASTDVDLFMQKVCPEPNTGCWLWTGALGSGGYGRVCIGGRGNTGPATHASYRLFVGDIPQELDVLHKCDTPACVNPGHLFLGTHADNMKDMATKGRWRWNGTHGERRPNAILTESLVREARIRRASGESVASIAGSLGFKRQTIGAAIRGRTWRHVI